MARNVNSLCFITSFFLVSGYGVVGSWEGIIVNFFSVHCFVGW